MGIPASLLHPSCDLVARGILSARFPSLLVELSTVDIFFQCVTCLVLFSFVWGCIARLLCS